MFPPRPAPGLGAVCNDWRGGRSGRRGAPKQGEPRTQPTALAVASATERIQEPLHPLPRTPAKSGRHIEDRVRAAGQRQETGHADSGLELEPEGRLGGYRRQTQRRTPSHTHTHTAPGPTPGYLLPCLTLLRCLHSPRACRYLWGSRPAAASRAGVSLPALPLPLRAPAPPVGRGHIGGGATAAGAGSVPELAQRREALRRPEAVSPHSEHPASNPRPRNGNSVTCVPDQLGGQEQDTYRPAPAAHNRCSDTATVSEHLLSIGTYSTHALLIYS